jgi:E3 SUMO-protein ligase PIAS1
MASPLPPISQADCDVLIRQVKSASLLNRQLSSICQVNGLKSTGIKADLQSRITSLILETFTANDAARFQQVRQSISNAQAQRSSPSKGTPSRMTSSVQSHQLPTPTLNYSTHAMPSYSPSNGLSRNFSTSSSNGIGPDMSFPTLAFAPSPFYRVETALTGVKACEIMSQHRNTVTFNLKASDHRALDKCIADSKTWRIMVFCAGEPNGVQQIAFPHQAELRVNSGDIKANLRGLKNKPGSTRPVDITDAIRLKQGNYMNSIDFTYALTSKKFYIVLNLCRVTLVDDLVTTISTRRRIPKDSVIMELNKKAQDPDVVATSQVLSLKCPLSYSRLATPCRSMSCTHIQCFDATSYLQLQQQGPQWLCPICNKSAPFEQLAVDE